MIASCFLLFTRVRLVSDLILVTLLGVDSSSVSDYAGRDEWWTAFYLVFAGFYIGVTVII